MEAQPQPVPKQAEVKAVEAIIVRPATSALPLILCNTSATGSSSCQPHTLSATQIETPPEVATGSKRKAAPEPQQKLSRQRSSSPSDGTASQIHSDAPFECPLGAAQLRAPGSALSHQAGQAICNVVTSGEYPLLSIGAQAGIRPPPSTPFAQQPDAFTSEAVASQTQRFGMQPQVLHEDPVSSIGYSHCGIHKMSSHSIDSCHLPSIEVPDFGLEPGDDAIAKHSMWGSGCDVQLPYRQSGAYTQPTACDQTDSLVAQHQPWDWTSIMDQGFQLNSQSVPYIPDMLPSPELPPALSTSWEQQAWQASWQNQQNQQQQQQQHLHNGKQQLQQLRTSESEPLTEDDGPCTRPAAATMGTKAEEPAESSNDAETAWSMLPKGNTYHWDLKTAGTFSAGQSTL